MCLFCVYACYAEESPFHLKEAFILIDETERHFFSTIHAEVNSTHQKKDIAKEISGKKNLHKHLVAKPSLASDTKILKHTPHMPVVKMMTSNRYPKVKQQMKHKPSKVSSWPELAVARIDLQAEKRQEIEKLEQAYQAAIKEVDEVK